MKQIQTQKKSLKEHRKTDQYGWLKRKHVVRKLCNVRARGNWEQKTYTTNNYEPKKWSENSYVFCENVAKKMEWNLEKWSSGVVELKEESIWDWIPSKNKDERES